MRQYHFQDLRQSSASKKCNALDSESTHAEEGTMMRITQRVRVTLRIKEDLNQERVEGVILKSLCLFMLAI